MESEKKGKLLHYNYCSGWLYFVKFGWWFCICYFKHLLNHTMIIPDSFLFLETFHIFQANFFDCCYQIVSKSGNLFMHIVRAISAKWMTSRRIWWRNRNVSALGKIYLEEWKKNKLFRWSWQKVSLLNWIFFKSIT